MSKASVPIDPDCCIQILTSYFDMSRPKTNHVSRFVPRSRILVVTSHLRMHAQKLLQPNHQILCPDSCIPIVTSHLRMHTTAKL